MKTVKTILLAVLFITIASCSSSDDDELTLLEVESKTITNLFAPQEGGQGNPVSGEFTKFNFETGLVTTSQTDWDIAFRGTTIVINGGESSGIIDEPSRNGEGAAYIATGTMESILSINNSLFVQDSTTNLAIPTGSGTGWYLYAGAPTHLITPIAGKILVFRTHNGKYAKIEILSYYKDAPENPDAFTDLDRYYTFNYVYQPNEGTSTF